MYMYKRARIHVHTQRKVTPEESLRGGEGGGGRRGRKGARISRGLDERNALKREPRESRTANRNFQSAARKRDFAGVRRFEISSPGKSTQGSSFAVVRYRI